VQDWPRHALEAGLGASTGPLTAAKRHWPAAYEEKKMTISEICKIVESADRRYSTGMFARAPDKRKGALDYD